MLSPLSLRLHRFLSILSLGGDRDGARFQRQDLPLRHRAALWGNRRIERFQSRLIRRSDRIHVAGFSGFGVATQESDVFAFGVMMLELLSGEESLKYRGRLRRWMDRRLGDSFPVTVEEKLMRLALECVEDEAVNRPEMGRVTGKISQLYLESEKWLANMKTSFPGFRSLISLLGSQSLVSRFGQRNLCVGRYKARGKAGKRDLVVKVSLQVYIADCPNEPIIEILQFEKHQDMDQLSDHEHKDPYGNLLKWLIPSAHKPLLSSGSGSQLFSFVHFRSYSMLALPAPNTAPVKHYGTVTSLGLKSAYLSGVSLWSGINSLFVVDVKAYAFL
ncbi:hypothetical protein HID58_029266, partial [Brassica napus]